MKSSSLRNVLPRSSSWRSADSQQAGTARSAEFGMHVVLPKDPTASDHVDIVAIHGLNGDFQRTWVDEATGKNWLTDLIPRFIPNARVMSFAYNSVVQFSKSTSDVFIFADQLLEGLMAMRESTEEQHRPILFICHSLGGIVFKQAHLRVFESERYMILRSSINAVMFFGTPHRGSALANWAGLFGGILKASMFGTSTNSQLLKDLEPRSRILETISRSFRDRCGHLTVVSVHETDRMSFLNSLVVDHDSAVLGLPSEQEIAMSGDHRTICRFSNLDEPRFQPVRSHISNIVRAAIDRYSNTQRAEDAFMTSLGNSSPEAQKNRNPAPVQGTCEWLLGHPKYLEWFKNRASSLLWLSADPGCGKSVLASFLVDRYTKLFQDKEVNVCYFFFKADNFEQSSAAYGLQSLLSQLYKKQPNLIRFGMTSLEADALWNVSQLWKALVQSVEAKSLLGDYLAWDTICILDGLDECEADSRNQLAQLVSKFFRDAAQKGGSTSQLKQGPAIKVLVTSRPENSIKIAFDKTRNVPVSGEPREKRQITSTSLMIRLRGEDETDSISDDITKVIKHSVSDLIDQGFPEELLYDAQAELIRRADRTFLWVTLILELFKEKVEAGASRREIDEILESRSIDVIYDELLSLNSRSASLRARKMLSIILAANQPLTVEELSIALAVIPEHDGYGCSSGPPGPNPHTFDDVEYDIVYPAENHVKALCGHFVRIIRGRVFLVHNTAREFLLHPKWMNEQLLASKEMYQPTVEATASSTEKIIFEHSFSLVTCRSLLLEICVTYLYLMGRKSRVSAPGNPSPKTMALLPYVSKGWVHHFHQLWHLRRLTNLRDIRFYHNICHPRFPGFSLWLAEYCAPLPLERFQGSDDIQQETCLRFLRMGHTRNISEADWDLDDGDDSDQTQDFKQDEILIEGEDDDIGQALMRAAKLWPIGNPTSLPSDHFPLTVDENGLVKLDHSLAHKKNQRQ